MNLFGQKLTLAALNPRLPEILRHLRGFRQLHDDETTLEGFVLAITLGCEFVSSGSIFTIQSIEAGWLHGDWVPKQGHIPLHWVTGGYVLSGWNYMKLHETTPNNMKLYETNRIDSNRHIDLSIQHIHLMPSNAKKKKTSSLSYLPFPGTWFWINFLYSAVVVAPERIIRRKFGVLFRIPPNLKVVLSTFFLWGILRYMFLWMYEWMEECM